MSDFVEIGLSIAEILRFFKMASVRLLGFVWDIFGPPTSFYGVKNGQVRNNICTSK